MAIPTFDMTKAPPGRMTMPFFLGGGIEGGRSLSGIVTSIDMSGGPLLGVKYNSIAVGNTDPSRLRYMNFLAAILNPGVRSIVVPFLVDFIQPANVPLFMRQPTLNGSVPLYTPAGDNPDTLAAAGNSNDGTVTINLGTRQLTGGEWFELVHPTRLNRCYCVTDILNVTANADSTFSATVGIMPPLRDSIANGAPVNWTRPKCLMRLEPGTTISMDVQDYWYSTPSVSFVESFGST